jgi:hypothetical protein
MGYVWALAACVATTLVATPLPPYLDLANIVMLFLLTIVLVAVRFGRGPAVLAAFTSVASFDFFFVPPRFSFAVSDAQYLVTFAIMLTVALITEQMTASLRYQARVASYREERARALYEFARTCRACCKPIKSSRPRQSSSPIPSAPKWRSCYPINRTGSSRTIRRARLTTICGGCAMGLRSLSRLAPDRYASEQRIPVHSARAPMRTEACSASKPKIGGC